jgi:histone H3/H4
MVSKKDPGLPRATVARFAHVKKGIRVNSDAVTLAIEAAENYISDLFSGALQFTEHRNGTMIMKKDVEAYIQSKHP